MSGLISLENGKPNTAIEACERGLIIFVTDNRHDFFPCPIANRAYFHSMGVSKQKQESLYFQSMKKS